MKEYTTHDEHRVRKPVYENKTQPRKKSRAAKARQQRLILAICVCLVLLAGIIITAVVSKNSAKKQEAEKASASIAAQQVTKDASETTLVFDDVVVSKFDGIMYSKSSNLNVRTEPNLYGQVLGQLGENEQVTVVGKCDNGWMQIKYDGQTAYCSGNYLTDEKPAETTTSEETSTELMTLAEASAGNVDNSNITGTSPYYLKVNRTQNVVIVYQKDANGKYNIPVKAMVCSVGLNGKTELGTFKIGAQQGKPARDRWRPLNGGVYGQYVSRFNGSILFHSVPYYSQSPSDLEYEEYNKLGQAASAGCVRLCVRDAKWIYDNCPDGTPVTVYDSSAPEPLAKPSAKKIDVNSPNRGWDPTDPNPSNPWK